MSESSWRSRLLQAVGNGLLRLGTLFVRQGETPPPGDAPPRLPPDFWQQSRPPAHWLALLAESQVPVQWVGTAAPPPALVTGTAADDPEKVIGDMPLAPWPWPAPAYAPGSPPPRRQQAAPAAAAATAPAPAPEMIAPDYAPTPRAALRLIPTPTTDVSATSAAPPAYLPDAPALPLPDPDYLPAHRWPATSLPEDQAAAARLLPAPRFALPALPLAPASPAERASNATYKTPPPAAAPDYAAGGAAGSAPPTPPYTAGISPSQPVLEDYGPQRPTQRPTPLPAPPDFPAGVAPSPPAPGDYGQLPLPTPLPLLMPPPPVFAPPPDRRLPDVAYAPLPSYPPEWVTPAAAPPTARREESPRYAPPASPVGVSQLDEAPPFMPPVDRWPALSPLFAEDAPAAAPEERWRRQRLDREQLGERG